eukprot:65839-Chlamydomonas_euryale.AAC.1
MHTRHKHWRTFAQTKGASAHSRTDDGRWRSMFCNLRGVFASPCESMSWPQLPRLQHAWGCG